MPEKESDIAPTRLFCRPPALLWPAWLSAPLLLFVPLLFVRREMFFGNWDALFYNNILTLTVGALDHGMVFSRWFADANYGFGSPVMLFYAPLAYLVTALLEWPLAPLKLGPDEQFIIGIYLSQCASGASAFLWLRRHFTLGIAFRGSLLFVLLPYKFIYIYDHFNLAQLWALAFLPVWMWSAEKLLQEKGLRAVACYALALAAVYYTHPLTVLAFAAVPAGYVIFFAAPGRRAAIYAKLGAAHLLAAGLCLMKILPQRHYLPWIHEEGFLQGRLDWHGNLYHVDIFLCAYYGIIAALMACVAKICRELQEAGVSGRCYFWASVIGIVAFLNLPVSAFMWEYVPVMKYLQFPAARLHAVALMGVIYLICVWLTHSEAMRRLSPIAYRKATLMALIAVFATATIIRIGLSYAKPNDLSLEYVTDARAAKLIIPPEYKTQWGCIDPARALELYRAHHTPEPVTAKDGSANIALRSWHPPATITFTADVQKNEAILQVRQCYFPLWQAREGESNIPLSASPEIGLIQIRLPQGHHAIAITFASEPAEVAAERSALVSLILCLVLLLYGCPPAQKNDNHKVCLRDRSRYSGGA